MAIKSQAMPKMMCLKGFRPRGKLDLLTAKGFLEGQIGQEFIDNPQNVHARRSKPANWLLAAMHLLTIDARPGPANAD